MEPVARHITSNCPHTTAPFASVTCRMAPAEFGAAARMSKASLSAAAAATRRHWVSSAEVSSSVVDGPPGTVDAGAEQLAVLETSRRTRW